MNAQPANKTTFGPEAGALNWAEGGTPNRWAAYGALWRAARATLYADAPTFPTYAPPPAAYEGGYDADTGAEILVPHGAMERDDSIVAGSFYYGYRPYGDTESGANQATYTTVALGYTDPLTDPDDELYGGMLPVAAQAQYQQPPPWDRGLF